MLTDPTYWIKIHDEVIDDFVRSLNNDITDEEITKGIKGLKAGKTSGIDLTYN